MTRKLGTWKSWGKQPNETMKRQEDQDECSHCGYLERSQQGHAGQLRHYAVGFSNKPEYCKPEYADKHPERQAVGVLVKECPKCFQFCHCHMFRIGCMLIERKVDKNPQFFKVPGVYEIFMQMLKEMENG